MNGHDYTDETDKSDFAFIGTASIFIYWPYFIGVLLALIALIALIICCSAAMSRMSKPGGDQGVNERSAGRGGRGGQGGQGANQSGRPHTLRDEYGFYRTRGYFQGVQQSPISSVRGGSVYGNPPSVRPRPSQMGGRSPGQPSYNI